MFRLLLSRILKPTLAFSIMLALPASASARNSIDVSFRGQDREIIRVTPEKSTGIDEVLVAYDSSALTEMIISDRKSTL